jgi:hypothetical protein
MEWSEQGQVYSINEQLGILVEVTVSDASLTVPSLVLCHFTGSRKWPFGRQYAWSARRSLHLYLSRRGRSLDMPVD